MRFSQRSKGHIRYFIDTGWTENHCCTHKLPTIHADDFEEIIVDKIRDKLSALTIKAASNDRDELQEVIDRTAAKITALEGEIEIRAFAEHAKEALGCAGLRYTDVKGTVKTVAVSSGPSPLKMQYSENNPARE